MIEEWRDIEGYEGLYQVSSHGRVKSLPRAVDNGYNVRHIKEKMIATTISKSGYVNVTLSKDGKITRFRLHRLVATAFIQNVNGLFEVNHKDENKQNNHVANLEWCDRFYNCNHGTRNERIGKNFSKAVAQYSLDGVLLNTYPSASDAERYLGVHGGHVSSCCCGKRETAYGYIWKHI